MPTTLTPGDIAIIGYNTTNPDSIRFILLVDITTGTTFNVTDNGWQSNGNFTTTEGILTYTAPSNISAGTVLTWTNGSSSNSSGFNSNSPFGFAFNTSGDSITIYTGTLASPTLIYALNSGTTGWSPNAINSTTSAEPTAANNGTLITGTSTVAILTANGYYNGAITSETKAQLLSAISNPANWTASSSITNLSNWQSSFTVNTASQPNLTISLSDSPDPVTVGNNLTYTFTVNNNGTGNASGVDVNFTLPTGLSVVGTPGVSNSFTYTGTI
ncbi:MAG: CARDB domain-containing protein, partial [Phormidium sp.]